MQSTKIALIEDEAAIADAISARLRNEGFDVATAADGPSGVELCRSFRPDLVILDVMLPGFDGVEVMRRVRSDSHVPVIMLTALDSETDKVVGLSVGADDYVTKPFSPRELVARVKALLRRAQRSATQTTRIEISDLKVDSASRRVRSNGEEIHLTPTEFDLLYVLASKPDTVFTREQLLQEIWGYGEPLGSRTVDSHIRSLRRKIGSSLIRTVHGVGYALGEGETG